ncbi:MAG: B12-binding domain-containing radical SAM protein [Candidatus Omnitrophica bacterium CG_4_9_14_0_2_um_filter_42_8]|nr:MAG: B12-binding domain-containing radical SAM protein [Candidatus Omnitrophica bacterium CG22_combo_CG10-13_8_21_14_all_43_16]PJC49094.1 MAG: B12-binding domain-containing radical SAM protein [Candidatus Omnitrophica bacterium CG_4_9_14_0_2_um_filter_42_8]
MGVRLPTGVGLPSTEYMIDILKPARYINSEWNAVHKEWDQSALKIALAFPDVYEIGMSHLGMRILYGILNKEKDVICERAFTPWPDMEKRLRDKKENLSSLESGRALKEFDIVGFSLQYEMNYPDVLNILDLGGVSLYSRDRQEGEPIVIAGGPCAFNPEPLADFVDAFVIGEAEEAILEIVSAAKGEGLGVNCRREAVLKKLSKIQGVYVPDHVIARPKAEAISEIASFPGVARNDMIVSKRIIKDLDNSFFPTDIIVPYIQIIHDRIGIEIMRGCPHQCKFCQACKIFHPLRIRSVKRIMEIAEESVKNTGYEELSLLSLSSGDYPHIEELAWKLEEKFKPLGVKVSLPSLRVGSFEERGGMDTLKRAGLTFAPEAGSERLRHALNKNIQDSEILEKSRAALNAGWKKVKLYFMIGLPGETGEDLDAITNLAGKIKNVNLSVSPFIPKPHSDFEREGMEGMEILKEKQKRLSSRLQAKGSRIKANFHSPETARIEGALARGDKNTARVILKAWEKGLRLQAWTEHFNYNLWEQAFQETGIDPENYLKKKEAGEILPWGFIV